MYAAAPCSRQAWRNCDVRRGRIGSRCEAESGGAADASDIAHPDARAQEFLRVDRVAVDARLVVQVRSGRAAGRAEPADNLADLDVLADGDVDLGEMAVACRQTVAVIDLDQLAVAAVPTRRGDGAGRGGADRIAGIAAEVEAGMHRRAAEERIDAHAEARCGVDLADHRFADRDRGHGARELFRLDARQADAMELALERVGVGGEPERYEGPAARRLRTAAAEMEPEVGEQAAHALDPGVIAFLQGVER